MISRSQAYRLLPVIDGGILVAALAAALAFRFGGSAFQDQWNLHLTPFLLVFLLWIVIFRMHDLYNPYQSLDVRKLFENTLRAFTIDIGVATIFFYAIPYFGITPRKNLLLIGGVGIIAFACWRLAFTLFIRTYVPLKIFLIGDAPEMRVVATHIAAHPELGMSSEVYHELTDTMVATMTATAQNYYVVLPESTKSSSTLMKQMYALLPSGVQVVDFASFYERLFQKIPVSLITELWFLEHIVEVKKPFFSMLKRFVDIVLGICIGAITLLLTPLIALAIKLDSNGPIILPNHYRIGKNGKRFQLYKFRSMGNNAEKHGPQWTQKNDPRITRVGKYLRELRLDELPQVLNILKGDMSFIGPRPERPEFVEGLKKEIPFYDMRHLVKPGLSGWAQINPPYYYAGTDETIIKLKYDLFYIKNRSTMLDASVLLKTVAVLLSRRGH